MLDSLTGEPVEVLARVREPVDVVDAQPFDDAVAHELERLLVRRREDRLVLDASAGEVADVEEPPVQTGARVEVEERAPQLRVGPERILLARGHVVRDDVEHDPETGAGKRAQLLLSAERFGDAARIRDVVAVRRALARLERRRQIEVRDAEPFEVRNERARLAEAELRRQLKPVRRAEIAAHATRRSMAIDRDSTSISSRAPHDGASSA